MARQRLEWRIEKHRLAAPFRISGYVFENVDFLVATLRDGDLRGRGEAAGVYYLGDTAERMGEQLEENRQAIEACDDLDSLQSLLPRGGARNAVDCAMWDLQAKRTGVPAWRAAGLDEPRPLVTTMTVGADDPDAMADAARRFDQARAIKLKLTGELDVDIARVLRRS
jgi:L-Ala-D/L-Glu epimerase